MNETLGLAAEDPPVGLHFRVHGTPTTQGSKRGFINPKTKRVIIVDDNSPALKTWRQDVTAAAIEARTEADPLDVPLKLRALFMIRRPQAHFGAHGLKASAPRFSSSAPDLDKLLRALLDAITISGLWRDDARVSSISAAKVYSDEPGVEVWITVAQ